MNSDLDNLTVVYAVRQLPICYTVHHLIPEDEAEKTCSVAADSKLWHSISHVEDCTTSCVDSSDLVKRRSRQSRCSC